MSDETVQLSEENFIASGAFCRCYRHPQIADQCIKITTDEKRANKRLKADLSYYKKLYRRNADLFYVADYLGTCTTNLGNGYLFECIVDSDGSVSKTIEYYLENKVIQPEIFLKELHHLGVHLLNNCILISDIHAKNVLIQLTEDNAPKPVVVDGIGDSVAITIQNIFKAEVRSKITRRWNRFANKLINSYPEYESFLQMVFISKNDIVR